MKPSLMAPSSFTCDLRIIQAKNTDSLPEGGNLFVRCYLSAAGKKRRTHLDTRPVTIPAAACSWDEAFSLQCSGAEDSIGELKQESLIFELRQRRRRKVALPGTSSSKLLGTAELPWRMAFGAPDMKLETWVPVIPSASISKEGEKPPSIRVAVEVKMGPETVEAMRAQRQRRKKRVEESKCSCGGRCEEQQWSSVCGAEYYEAFVMASVLEAF